MDNIKARMRAGILRTANLVAAKLGLAVIPTWQHQLYVPGHVRQSKPAPAAPNYRQTRPTARQTTAELIAALLGNHSTTILDVGARWGLGNSWFALTPLAEIVGFDPDPDECLRLNQRLPPGAHERYVPAALGRATGTARLHHTADPSCTSLYEPNQSMVARYPELAPLRETGASDVTLTTLDVWAAQHGGNEVSFIKLDTQGSELDILMGAEAMLGRCLGMEVEVEFAPMYKDQPLFSDVDQFLRARGFTLWRLGHLVHYSERPERRVLSRQEVAYYDSKSVASQAGNGRLMWGHALYFREPAAVSKMPTPVRRLATLASLLDAAGDVDAAAATLRWTIDGHRSELSADTSGRLENHLSSLHLEL